MREINPVWKPLEEKLGPNRCVGFMYMRRVNGVHQYKHGITRTYLYLDDRGSCYVWNQPSGFANADFATELAKLEADLRGCDATLEAPYDDHYIARKEELLQSLGIQTLRIKIEPEDRILNPGPHKCRLWSPTTMSFF
jgi:hypothetical protein